LTIDDLLLTISINIMNLPNNQYSIEIIQ